jgi:RNA polymerase sigma-70 factor (ECF subfamily)
VRLAVQGCEDSFTQLAEHFRPRLIHFIRRKINSNWQRLDPEDVAQVALSKAYQHIGTYNAEYQFSTWLYTIAVRVAQDQLRQNRKWWTFRSLPSNASADNSVTADNHKNLECRTEARDTVQNIWAVAQRVLTDDQYLSLWLRYSEDLTVSEIASVMRRSPVGIRVLLHRGRLALLEYIKE